MENKSPLLAAYRKKTISLEAQQFLVDMLNDPNRVTHSGEEVPLGDRELLLKRIQEKKES